GSARQAPATPRRDPQLARQSRCLDAPAMGRVAPLRQPRRASVRKETGRHCGWEGSGFTERGTVAPPAHGEPAVAVLPSCPGAPFGLGLALADPTKDDPQDEAKIKLAKIQIRTLTLAAETYKLNNGDWPPDLKVMTEVQPNGGAALLEVKALTDPW